MSKNCPASQLCSERPFLFDDFIDSGLADENSPFLKPAARPWAKNLELKACFLAAILLILSWTLSWYPNWMPVSNLLLVCVFVFSGMPALIDSIDDLINLEINIDVLMTLAAFSSVLIGSGLEGALLLVLFAISGAMEHTVTQRAKGALSNLRKLAPSTAWVLAEDGRLLQRAVRDIAPDTRLLIKAGEVVPLDGEVLEGESSVNLVHLTGESLPVRVGPGDSVAAGAQNQDGALTLKVTAASSDSTLAKIIRLVTQAQST
ncbi:MAG: cation-translocating P-type ATPase, partial [Chlamydiia bacterium]|nr:cation-translocating P-type ATPase [Chlamydiia bacterium]